MRNLGVQIIERFELEGALKDNLVQTACRVQEHLSLDQIAQTPVHPDCEHFHWWGIHNFSEKPLLTTLIVNNFFLIPNLNLSSLSLKHCTDPGAGPFAWPY